MLGARDVVTADTLNIYSNGFKPTRDVPNVIIYVNTIDSNVTFNTNQFFNNEFLCET